MRYTIRSRIERLAVVERHGDVVGLGSRREVIRRCRIADHDCFREEINCILRLLGVRPVALIANDDMRIELLRELLGALFEALVRRDHDAMTVVALHGHDLLTIEVMNFSETRDVTDRVVRELHDPTHGLCHEQLARDDHETIQILGFADQRCEEYCFAKTRRVRDVGRT